MRLLIVLITYNRLAYTKRTLRNLRKTIELPYFLVIVDNNSTDGTKEWLRNCQSVDLKIFNEENYYPGAAANIGWEAGLKEYPYATHLMRLDNDMELKKGWDLKAQEYFKTMKQLGQLGYDYEAVETDQAKLSIQTIDGMTINPFPGCVGGPCIIKRNVFDSGIRYVEDPWKPLNPRIPTAQEDYYFSKAIKDAGYIVGHMTEEFGRTFANKENWIDYPEYYDKTMRERGYYDEAEDLQRKVDEK